MKRILAVTGLAFVLVAGATAMPMAADRLPFGVTLAGERPANGASFATVATPVAADAELVVEVDAQMVTINVFPCDEKGTVKNGAAPAVIMIQGGKKVKMDQTVDKKKLAAGNYIMNIVAGDKTARVKFTVK